MKDLKLWLAAALIASPAVALAEREMTTDRPDRTETPYTVGRGRIQVETTVVGYTRDLLPGDWEVHAVNVAWTNLRLGYTPNTELQIATDGYLDVQAEHRWTRTDYNNKGLGDTRVRYKWNLRGNDAPGSALAVMPWVKIPTAKEGLGNRKAEGGIIVPYARELEHGWKFGAKTEVAMLRDGANLEYRPVWINAVTLGQNLGGKVGGFVELTSRMGDGHHQLSFDAGLTYAVNKDLQLDAGAQLGLSNSAPDIGLFTGFSKRF